MPLRKALEESNIFHTPLLPDDKGEDIQNSPTSFPPRHHSVPEVHSLDHFPDYFLFPSDYPWNDREG